MILPGGRDIDPKQYGQELNGSKIVAESDLRYNFNKRLMNELAPDMPVFGICWGLQFLNVYFGGDLVQNIEDSAEHYRLRRFSVLGGSILESAVGGEMVGNCYHHQGIGRLGRGIKVTAIDDFSKEPHALEYSENGRFIFSVLWHPEHTYTDESRTDRDKLSVQLSRFFVEKCTQYKSKQLKN